MKSAGILPDSKEIVLTANTSLLISVAHNIVLAVYHKLDNNSMDIDIVNLMPYKKVVDPKMYANWNKTNWGFVRLDDIKLPRNR